MFNWLNNFITSSHWNNLDKLIKVGGAVVALCSAIYVSGNWLLQKLETLVQDTIRISVLEVFKTEQGKEFSDILQQRLSTEIKLITRNQSNLTEDAYLLIIVGNKDSQIIHNKTDGARGLIGDNTTSPFSRNIDSGYTYYFKLSKEDKVARHEFKFYADRNTQQVFCYLLGSSQKLYLGTDISIRIDGKAWNTNDGDELNDTDITGALKDQWGLEGTGKYMHTFVIEEI